MNAAKSSNVSDLTVESLLPGRENGLRQLFNQAGLRAPEITWTPSRSELHSPLHRQFEAKCRQLAGPDGRILKKDVAAADFGGLSDWQMLIEVRNDGEDFLYTHYGKAISESSGIDMSDRLVSDFGGHVSTFFMGLYRAILKTGQWVYSQHESPREMFVRSWQRLIVPLYDEAGSISHLLALNVPDNELSVGLELMIDPVFVVDQDRKVLFSNRAGRKMFNIPLTLPREHTLDMLTGIDLDCSESPEDLLSQNRVIDSVELTRNGSIMERLVMTVSAAEHRGQAFYVVVMRMVGT